MEKKKYKQWAGLSGQFQVKFDGNLHVKMDENVKNVKIKYFGQ